MLLSCNRKVHDPEYDCPLPTTHQNTTQEEKTIPQKSPLYSTREIPTHPCLLVHYLQQLRTEICLDIHQQVLDNENMVCIHNEISFDGEGK